LDGVPEVTGTTREDEDACLRKVYDVFEQKLLIPNARQIQISRCHRVGSKQFGPGARPRSIIMKFHWFGDRKKVWEAKSKLKDTGFFLNEDFPREINERRKLLLPIMHAARKLGHVSYLVVDKLHIGFQGGKHVVYDVRSLHTLPNQLQPQNVASRSNDQCYAFFTALSPLSNFYDCSMNVDGIYCRNVEHYYQLMKARFAKDDVSESRINSAGSPLQCKLIGDRVRVDREQWGQACETIMRKALFCKFQQNKVPRDLLLRTGTKMLAEASTDLYWGTGFGLRSDDVTNINKWKGKNRLGQLLMDLRQDLMNSPS
jgi:ribA/ribD-fused uncharacterized protein